MGEQPRQALGAMTDPLLEPLFYRPSRLGPDSAWYGHLPFANWIMRAARPALFVELGTHAGISYAGFCDAVLACHLPTRCVAIDTWEGDEHAGFYGSAVFEELSRFHDQRYGSFSRLLRCRFDQALDTLPDGSVDLLHIDGRHRLDDVTEDFNSWLPKLSPRAVVLLHDTNVRERDFGVWRFWDRQRTLYPSFEFLHAHGLGVLAVGEQAPEAVLALCRLASEAEAAPEAVGLLRERFALAGERWEKEYALTARDRHIAHLSGQSQDVDRLRARGDLLDREMAALHARLMEADAYLRDRALELGLTRSALAEAKAARHDAVLQGDADVRLAREEAAAAQAMVSERDAELATLAERTRELDAALAARTAEMDAALAARTAEMEAIVAARTQEVELLRNSFFWKATAPLRRILDGVRGVAAGPSPTHAPLPGPAAAMTRPADPIAPVMAVNSAEPEPVSVPVPEPVGEAPPPRAIRHVVFVVGEPDTPGAMYRCVRNAAACRAAGYGAETIDLYDVNPENLARADLLVLWRTTMSPHIETMMRLARETGTTVAFDVDDLMTRPELARIDIIDGIRTIGANEVDTRAWFAAMRQTMMAADFCIATTEELASQMRQQREVVHVLPNTFDEATHRAARYARRRREESGEDGHVRVGYAGGTRTHQKDFALSAPALARVLRARPQTLLVLFREAGNHRGLLEMEEFPELADLAERIEWRDMVPLAALPGELARFDVSICPLEAGNPFCEAKSELKFFEAALAGVCTVASPTGPYRRAIRDGITGFLADGDAGWEEALLRLVDDPPLRRRVGQDAYHDVLWRFGPWRQAELAGILLGSLDPAAAGSPAAAHKVELGLRRGDYLGCGLPEVPDSELLFAHDKLGEAQVTVVMTSFNYEQHILDALDSVRAQSLEALDLAVVDDGSTDQSVPLVIEWARRYRDRFNRIRILRTRRNAGLGGARNVVFDAAETPWLMTLDSDNRLLPDACVTLLAALGEVPRAAFAYPQIRQFGGAELVMGTHGFDPARLRTGNYIDAMAMVAKWAWAAAGGYYVRRDAMGWEDFDLWLNLVELGQFGIAVPEILAEYRVHPGSMVNVITEQSDNKRAMVEFVEARHPWLSLRTRTAKLRA